MMKGCKVLILAAWFISLLSIVQFSSPAWAEVKTDGKSVRDSVDLGEIIVTAEKQEKDVQDVPVAVTVMDSQDIEDKKIESVPDIIDFVPNMMGFSDSWGLSNMISLRGVSAPLILKNASAVGMYVDGVPTLSNFGLEEGIVDVERIEVLRGPQGTLYGKNTQVGAINIITRQPDNTFKARVSAEAGQFLSSASDDKLIGGASLSISGPIIQDKLFLGLAGTYKHKDGFMYNTYAGDAEYDHDNYYGRAKLLWSPVERLDISLLLSSLYFDQDGNMNMNLGENGAAYFGIPTPSRAQSSSDLDSWMEVESETQSLKVSYALSDQMNLTSITSRKETTLKSAFDLDMTSAHIMHAYYKDPGDVSEKISQELRLDSTSDKLNWLVGCYYDTDDVEMKYIQTSIYPSMIYDIESKLTGNAYAVFGQLGYFFTEKIKLTGGLRYEHQDFEMERLLPTTVNMDESWERVSPKIAVEYHAKPDMMFYVDVSEGYRSGGFNELATDPQYYSFDEESLISYELGMKSLLMNKRLMLNTAIFYMDISDMQVTELIDLNTGYITNAAKATSYGLELELTARITDSLTLMGGFGYTHIEFDEFSDAGGDYAGNKTTYAPDYTFSIGAQYRNTKGYYARIDLIGYGKIYIDKANTYYRDPYQIINTKIGYEMDRFDIYLYGKNLLDEEYDAPHSSGVYVLNSSPGEIGLQIVCRF